MSEENIKKAEELKETAELSETGELSDAELDGVAGGAFGFGFLKSYLDHQEKEREAAARLAQPGRRREGGGLLCERALFAASGAEKAPKVSNRMRRLAYRSAETAQSVHKELRWRVSTYFVF